MKKNSLDPARQLIGRWRSDPANSTTLSSYGNVSLEFTDRGELLYTVHSAEKEEVILLTYRVEGDVLITDQLSEHREEKTGFAIDADRRLHLTFEGVTTTYVRESEA